MRRTITAALVLMVLAPALRADEAPQVKSRAAEEYQALVDEYAEVRRAREFSDKFLALAAKYPRDAVATQALAWVLTNDSAGPAAQRAVDVLLKDHLASSRLGKLCQHLGRSESLAAERLLRTLIERSPHRDVQNQARFGLAGLLSQQASYATELKEQPADRKRIEKFLGAECVKHLTSLDLTKVEMEREKLYETIVKSYGEANVAGDMLVEPAKRAWFITLVEPAKRELFIIRHLSIGKVAADIEGEDIDGVKFKLSDYRGKVVLLDFWGDW